MLLKANMDQDCEAWILKNLPEHLTLFSDNDFKTLESLDIIDNDDLKDMGVNSVGIRKTILARTLTLKKPLVASCRSAKPEPSGTHCNLTQKCKILFTNFLHWLSKLSE